MTGKTQVHYKRLIAGSPPFCSGFRNRVLAVSDIFIEKWRSLASVADAR
jgi:hypothetical protein